MCDYSLMHAKSRPAEVGDKLVVKNFGSGTRGFAPQDRVNEGDIAVCVKPGTEIAFSAPIKTGQPWFVQTLMGVFLSSHDSNHTVAIFRQINKDEPHRHHDALETPDGRVILLTGLTEGQTATVLQLPAIPKNEKEVEEQRRVAVVG